MPVICPAILADGEEEYQQQIKKVAHFAHRIQIDLTDGIFAEAKTVKPEQAWWPVGFKADFHLMYGEPLAAVRIILEHRPNLIIIHAEAKGDFRAVAEFCKSRGVKVGVALLASTTPESILPALEIIDHVLIFSGKLGHYGGHANLELLKKIHFLKSHKANLEFGWDGGITDQNVAALVNGGVDVLNVGGFIQKSTDPARAYASLARIADETGTT